MAKDGTRRGGARIHSGPEKVVFPDFNKIKLSEEEEKIYAKAPTYFSKKQHSGIKLDAKKIYIEVQSWLDNVDCLEQVPLLLIEQYALSYARWRQAEEIVSEKGIFAPHPTTRVAIKSPSVDVVNLYFKASQTAWYSIWAIVKDSFISNSNETDDMEALFQEV